MREKKNKKKPHRQWRGVIPLSSWLQSRIIQEILRKMFSEDSIQRCSTVAGLRRADWMSKFRLVCVTQWVVHGRDVWDSGPCSLPPAPPGSCCWWSCGGGEAPKQACSPQGTTGLNERREREDDLNQFFQVTHRQTVIFQLNFICRTQ